ncbi:hypothetical protein GQ43DRAFT_394521 [Delitschia confertaspora ATCC 74209]|uniref:PXA domain-containing protein n=1 Tax=Delitschia confertaspora ATCC 74209 TaxID=1513339 RepID=A0A9P4JN34_9PLEO|nr:hypothetical protein GQ43DRAFT_394521 [Delitschia confertaspora ATCC 74209]
MSDPIQTPPSPASLLQKQLPQESETTVPDSVQEKPLNVKEFTSTAAENPPFDFQAFRDHALHFLANASNESLGACIVGLGAATYLVLGRIGLVLIGIVGGVVLHATWEGSLDGQGEDKAQKDERRRRELAIEVAHRILDWRDSKDGKNLKSADEETDLRLYSGQKLDYSEFRPETAVALTELTDAVIRDYVKWWYSPILPTENLFPSSCRQTLTAFILSVSNHLSRKRPADTFLDFVTNSSSITIVFFNELSAALAASPSTPVPEAIETYLQTKPESNLAHVLDTKNQAHKLDIIAEDILQNYLEPKTYNCRPAHTFLREILAKVVLEMTLVACSKPEWINGWIVYLLEEGEPELINAIDAGVEGSTSQLQKVKANVDKHERELASLSSSGKDENTANHKRVVSKAQEAMDEAMREAQRLSAMIAEEEAKKLKEQQTASSTTINEDHSENTTQGIITPTSSQSDALAGNGMSDFRTSDVPSMEPPQASLPSPERTREKSPERGPEKEIEEPPKRAFTSFDQFVPFQPPTALMANPPEKPPPLTLYNSKIVIFDDSVPGERGVIKNKPVAEYLVQIEPASHHHSGWMTARKFTDLETLHEILRRIAPITGATGFTDAHANLPAWKGQTKASLRTELEKYLNDAVRYRPLAESEGMKRFLEKDTGINKNPGSGKSGFGGIWPGQTFESMGKGMIDVLTKAPKEVAGGGKALFGGVTGILGNVASPLVGQRSSISSSPSTLTRTTSAENKPTPTASPSLLSRTTTVETKPTPTTRHGRAESTVSELPTHIRTESTMSSFTKRPSTDIARRTSTESLRNPNSPIIDQQPAPVPQMDRRPSYQDLEDKRSGRSSIQQSRSNSRAPSARASMDLSSLGGDQFVTLPPLPSDIPDDYTGSPTDPFHTRHESRASTTSLPLPSSPAPPLPDRRPSTTSIASVKVVKHTQMPAAPSPSPSKPEQQPPKQPKSYNPLSEQETTVLIELFFAVINELYTLSSAWQIRRTLLNAAKTFLLRPGNPQLSSITTLIQSTVLDANLSDSGIAYHLRKIRENSLPSEEELKSWPGEMSEEGKRELRERARALLVERGMPAQLMSVMGSAASGEALGRVFDCLQVEGVARGMVFGLLLQGLRAVVQ